MQVLYCTCVMTSSVTKHGHTSIDLLLETQRRRDGGVAYPWSEHIISLGNSRSRRESFVTIRIGEERVWHDLDWIQLAPKGSYAGLLRTC
jgi:hypothetical protein